MKRYGRSRKVEQRHQKAKEDGKTNNRNKRAQKQPQKNKQTSKQTIKRTNQKTGSTRDEQSEAAVLRADLASLCPLSFICWRCIEGLGILVGAPEFMLMHL